MVNFFFAQKKIKIIIMIMFFLFILIQPSFSETGLYSYDVHFNKQNPTLYSIHSFKKKEIKKEEEFKECKPKFIKILKEKNRALMQGGMVRITCQGDSYHINERCSRLSPNVATTRIIKKVNLKMAIFYGYTFCKVCSKNMEKKEIEIKEILKKEKF